MLDKDKVLALTGRCCVSSRVLVLAQQLNDAGSERAGLREQSLRHSFHLVRYTLTGTSCY